MFDATNGHIQDQISLRCLINAEPEGKLIAFNNIAYIALGAHHTDPHRDRRGVDGVVNDRDDVGVIYRDAGEPAALHRIYGCLECFAIFINVVALHWHQHRTGG